ncbi:hypothetical protein BKA81DRAFT_53563 [Phyllosticta paracitricarpa]
MRLLVVTDAPPPPIKLACFVLVVQNSTPKHFQTFELTRLNAAFSHHSSLITQPRAYVRMQAYLYGTVYKICRCSVAARPPPCTACLSACLPDSFIPYFLAPQRSRAQTGEDMAWLGWVPSAWVVQVIAQTLFYKKHGTSTKCRGTASVSRHVASRLVQWRRDETRRDEMRCARPGTG